MSENTTEIPEAAIEQLATRMYESSAIRPGWSKLSSDALDAWRREARDALLVVAPILTAPGEGEKRVEGPEVRYGACGVPGCTECKPEFVEAPGGAASTSTPEEDCGCNAPVLDNGACSGCGAQIQPSLDDIPLPGPGSRHAYAAPEQPEEPTCERCGGSREICRECGTAIAACICDADRRYRPTEPCPDCSTQESGGEEEWPPSVWLARDGKPGMWIATGEAGEDDPEETRLYVPAERDSRLTKESVREKLKPVASRLESIRDLDEELSDGSLGSIARDALDELDAAFGDDR